MPLNRWMKILIVFSFAFSTTATFANPAKKVVQDDPVVAPDAAVVPVIDGNGDDACCQDVPWQSIDQVWITYGDTIPPEDYTGQYKVVWSSVENLLYFLVQVTDDVFVDGFGYKDGDI